MLSQPVTGLASSLVKALRVLLVLEDSPAGRGVSEIARELGLPKSAVHRMLVTFQQQGFVQQHPSTSRYRLGPTLARLGLRASEMFSPRQVARPYLEALGQEVGETVFLGILSPAGVLVVDKVEHGQVLRISPPLGTVLPLDRTALGKVLLAHCDAAQQPALLEAARVAPGERLAAGAPRDIRRELRGIAQQGFAVSLGEWMPDICCLAVPIHHGQEGVSTALALALPRSRMPQPPRHDPFASRDPATQYPTLLPALLATAERISAALP